MSDTLWPKPKSLIDPVAVNKNVPGLAKMIATRAAESPKYKAIAGKEASYGAAGLPGFGAMVSAIPGATGLAPLAAAGGALLGSAAVPAAAAYGIGKLVAPKLTDEVVGKIKDFIMSKFNKASAIGSAYETGMAESIPGSRFAEKYLLPESAKDTITQIKNQHPLAAKAGQAAGTVGMMALPGANVVKGAGVLGTAANAAINAAPFALGTGLDVGATTGDVGKGVKAGLLSQALGTAAPTAISALTKIPAVGRWLAKMQLAAAGIRSGDVQKITRGYAKSRGMSGGQVDTYAAQHSDDLINQAADLIGEHGAGRAGKEAVKKWNSEGFQAHAKLFDDLTGKRVAADDIAAVLSDSDLAPAIARFGEKEVKKVVRTLAKEIDGQGWTASRRALSEYSKAGNNFQGLAADDPRILKAAIADAFHDRVDVVADRLAEAARGSGVEIPSLHLLKATYPATLAMTKAAAREAGGISGRFAGGSDTAMRMLLGGNPIATMAGAGAGMAQVPGLVGDIGSNPEKIPADLLGILGASVGGRLLNRGLGRAAELGTGAAAGAIRRAGEVPNAALGRLLGQSGELLAPAQDTGGAMPTGGTLGSAPEAPQMIQPQIGNFTPPPQNEMAPVAPQGAQPISNAPSVPIPAEGPSPQEIAQVDFQKAGQPPQKIGKWSEPFVEARIQEKWRRYQRQFGEVPYDEYKAGALRATQNLDPSLPSTWQAMFDDKETGTKLYNGYMNLQKIADVDPASALNHYTRMFWQKRGTMGASTDQRKEDQDNAKLVQGLSDMTKQPVKEIDSRLKMIAWDKGKTPDQRKQAVLDMIVNEGGIDVPLLVKMGLW